MQDYDGHAPRDQSARQTDYHGREHLADTEIQTSKLHSLVELLWEHTLFLRFFYLLLLAVTILQFLDVWQGELWALPSADVWHEHMDWLVEMHMALTEHNETLHHVARSYQRTDAWLLEPELFHPESIGRIVGSHWQTPLVLTVLYLNSLLAASVVARKIFLYTYKRYTTLIATYAMCVLSLVAQIVAMVLRVYTLFSLPTWCGVLGVVVNGICILPEILSIVDLYKMRSTIMWLSMHYTQLNVNLKKEVPGEEGEEFVAEMMQKPRPWKDQLTEMLVTGAANVDGLRRRKPWVI